MFFIYNQPLFIVNCGYKLGTDLFAVDIAISTLKHIYFPVTASEIPHPGTALFQLVFKLSEFISR